MTTTKLLLGAHVSAAGGAYRAIESGEKMGAACIQIFGASPRGWNAPLPLQAVVHRFKEERKKSRIEAVFLHAAYLINLAASDDAQWKKSVENLAAHLEIAHLYDAEGLVFHLGSGNGSEKQAAYEKTVRGMKLVLEKIPGSVKLIMENSAGGGDKLGANPEEMQILKNGVGSPRVKVCFDTAHAFESGIVEYTSKAAVKDHFDEWDRLVGIENIVALHANDSKTGPGSHHDRHENIGEGYIGLSGFKNLASDKRLHDKSWILEVPGFDDQGPDKKNLDILKSVFE